MHLAVTQILAGGAAAASQPILLFGTIQISHNRYLATKSARYYDTFAIFTYLSNMIHELSNKLHLYSDPMQGIII